MKFILKLLLLAVFVEFADGLQELTCDFSSGEGSLSNKYISICVRKFGLLNKIDIICPKNPKGIVQPVNVKEDVEECEDDEAFFEYMDIIQKLKNMDLNEKMKENNEEGEYTIIPEGVEEMYVLLKDELSNSTKLDSYGVWDIFGTKTENVVSRTANAEKEIVTLKPPSDGIVTVKTYKILMYICINKKHLSKINNNFLKLLRKILYRPSSEEYQNLYLPLLGGIDEDVRAGIAFIIPKDMPKVVNGCGNVPNRFFKNYQDYNRSRGFTECKIDLMVSPFIGFYCEGIVKPIECLYSFKTIETFSLITLEHHMIHNWGILEGRLNHVNYKTEQIYSSFRGYCDCLDRRGRITARIIVERKTEHTFNLPQMIMKNRVRPIRGDWFEVTIHPGDKLKIILPPNRDNIECMNYIINRDIPKTIFGESETSENKDGEPIVVAEEDESEKECDISSEESESHMEEDEYEEISSVEEEEEEWAIGFEDDEGSESDNPYCDMLFANSEIIKTLSSPSYQKTHTRKYPFFTLLSPIDIKTHVNAYNCTSEIVTQMPISELFGGNSLVIDTSEVDKGILKIERKNKPLAMKKGIDDIYYYWILKYGWSKKPEIVAKINVILAQTHDYCAGCETVNTGIFYNIKDAEFCKYHFNLCQKQGIKHNTFDITSHLQYGISCSEDERLYPPGYGSIVVDQRLNMVVNANEEIKTLEYPSIKNFKIFGKKTWQIINIMTFYVSCLDPLGIEKSRLTLYYASYESHTNQGCFNYGEYILLIPKVSMFLPPFDHTKYARRGNNTNSLPETECIPIPKNTLMYHLELRQGTKFKLSVIKPKPLYLCEEVEIDHLRTPVISNPNLTIKGVRKGHSFIPSDVYTDASYSSNRIFPVNLTKYTYRIFAGTDLDYLVPTEYSSMIATNVAGLKLKVLNYNNEFRYPFFENLVLYLPIGSIIIIKSDILTSVDLIYASGSISEPEKPKSERSKDSLGGESTQQATTSTGYDKNENEGKEPPSIDMRKMEIWGIHSIRVRGTNPWVHGCGVNGPSEDFFKDTEKIIENGSETGCRVDIREKEYAGFYCPEPYRVDPPGCFKYAYTGEYSRAVMMKDEILDDLWQETNGFRYLKLKRNLRSQVLMTFLKRRPYVCFCRTVKGIMMSKIEVII
ncbi:uncharacterized protein TA03640 [Theileria annulata]|uniref:6-Cys domain-containing protein n=1 Tax=Theileria annulata TaxID=5874 RepID=Q4UCH0_THEAN|nr:uncharacterized protein TA03640 [Theileria annulata]CAI75481.1 hypothetical protein TA03640 [Theileria annulata]|eukprot:XP_954957.1 hypothetical protein TA03640 [Theileria annulata]